MRKNVDDSLVKWLHMLRREYGILMDDLTLLSGISQGHISRIETGASKLTVSSCVQLVYGLGQDYRDVASFLKVPVLYPTVLGSREYIDASDIGAFLKYYRAERREAVNLLGHFYHLVHDLIKREGREPTCEYWEVDDVIWKATEASPVELSPLPYPSHFKADNLLEIFLSGGAITFRDAGVFVRKRRGEMKKSLRNMADEINISHVALTRFEQGRIGRSSFSTVIGIGEALDAVDEVLGIVWAASEYDTSILFQRVLDEGRYYPSDDLQRNLANTLMTIFRWFNSFHPRNLEWIDKLRDVLNPFY